VDAEMNDFVGNILQSKLYACLHLAIRYAP